MISLLEASLHAVAALGSHARTDFRESAVLVENRRMQLVSSAFPYLFGEDGDEVPSVRTETMDELFDQLDEIVAREKKPNPGNGDASVEPTERKLV